MSFSDAVVQPGPNDAPLQIRLTGKHSEGGLSVVEMEFAPGAAGPPLHIHPTHGEGFYVLSGEMSFQVGEDIITGGPGTWAYAPKHAPHTLGNLTDDYARVLCLFTPAGFESRFERQLAELAGDPLPALSVAEQQTQVIGPNLAER